MSQPWLRYQNRDQSGYQTRPADPVLPYRVQNARNDAAISGNRAAASVYDAEIARANAEKARSDAARAQAELQAGGGTPEQRAAIEARRANLRTAGQQLLRVSDLYRSGYRGGDLLDSIQESFPDAVSPQNSRFNAAASGLSEAAFAGLRVPGGGTQTDADLENFLRANQPRAQSFDSTIEERLDTVQRRLNEHYQALGLPVLDWRNREEAAPPPSPGIDQTTQRSFSPNTQSQTQLSDGTVDVVEDPSLRALAGRLGQMMSAGVPDREILDFLRANNVDPGQTDIRSALQHRRTPAFRAWRQQNPDAPYPIADNFWRREVRRNPDPLSSNANSAGGAYAVQTANALMGNRLDDLVGMTGGDADRARAGIAGLRQEHPIASMAGDISGQGMAYFGGNRIASQLPSFLAASGGARALAGDAAYGAYAGSGDDNTLGGMAATVAGGQIGRRVAPALGAAVGGVRNETVRRMTDQGFPLTAGQIAGQGGRVGQMVRGVEQRMSGLPVVGDFLQGQYRAGAEQGVRRAHQHVLEPIGGTATDEVGEAAVGNTLNQIQAAYRRALGGVNLARDRAFDRQLTAVARSAARPAMTQEVRGVTQAALAQVNELFAGSAMTGENFHNALRIIAETRSAVTKLPSGQAGERTLRDAERALMGMARRQAPAVVPALNRANAAYRRFAIVRDATAAATNDADGVFSSAQFGTAIRQNTNRFGGRNAAASPGRPFEELHGDMRRVLPNRTPDSGTAGRMVPLVAGTTIAAGGAGSDALGFTENGAQNAALAAGLLLPFTNPGRAAIQGAAVRRPELLRNIGDLIRDNDQLRRYPGLLGSQYLPYSTGERY